jgi:hypothetical protein
MTQAVANSQSALADPVPPRTATTAGPGLLRRVCRTRWPFARLVAAVALLLVLLSDNPARLARLQLAALPDFDYVAEVRQLREAGRFGEALVVADAGLRFAAEEGADDAAYHALQHERDLVVLDRDSVLRKFKAFGVGALVGQGDSLESLAGAVTADLFVVGDVRDLLIEGSKLAVDGEADEFILALSGVGLATTVAPQIDWAASLLKVAKKVGALTKGMTGAVGTMARTAKRTGDLGPLRKLSDDLVDVSKRASPSGTIKLLKHVDDPKDVEKLSSYLKRQPGGAFALHVTGKEGVRVVTKGVARGADDALVLAARKGDSGVAWLRTGNARLLRPHPILGLVKVGYKGTGARLLRRAVSEYVDPAGWFILPLVATWAFVEGVIVLRRLSPQTA